MLVEIGNEARQRGQSFSMDDFWPQFFSATFENWQSEWLKLLVQAVVLLGMKHVLFKADALDMEQMRLDLAEIKEHLGIPRVMKRPSRNSRTPEMSEPRARTEQQRAA